MDSLDLALLAAASLEVAQSPTFSPTRERRTPPWSGDHSRVGHESYQFTSYDVEKGCFVAEVIECHRPEPELLHSRPDRASIQDESETYPMGFYEEITGQLKKAGEPAVEAEILEPDSVRAIFEEALAEIATNEREEAKAVIRKRLQEIQHLEKSLERAKRSLANLLKEDVADIALL